MSNLTLTEIRWLIFANFDEQISNSQILLRLPYIEQVLGAIFLRILEKTKDLKIVKFHDVKIPRRTCPMYTLS